MVAYCTYCAPICYVLQVNALSDKQLVPTVILTTGTTAWETPGSPNAHQNQGVAYTGFQPLAFREKY